MELRRLIPILMLLLFAGCEKDQWDDCITSTGAIREDQRTTGGFHTVDLQDRVDLLLEQRDAGTVVVEAGINLMGQVVTEVRDSILYVRNDNRCNWVRSFKPRITVKVPIVGIRHLVLRGTGEVNCADTIRAGHFVLEQWSGQGSASLMLAVDRADIALHTGAGDVTAHGRCNEEVNLYSGMMGPIDASDLHAPVVNVNNSGATDIRCWAQERLHVQIRDVGDIYFRGDPTEVHADITGSGSLIHE